MFAQFLMVITLIGGGAFANEGGHKCVESQGFQACAEKMLANGKQEYKVND